MTRKEMTEKLVKIGDLVDIYDDITVNQDMNDPEYTKAQLEKTRNVILLECKDIRKDKKFSSLHNYERHYVIMVEKEFL